MKIKTAVALLLGMVLFSLFVISPVYSAELRIIANSSVPVGNLDREIISNIYAGKEHKWSNGDTIRVAMLKSGDIHEQFAKDILGTTTSNLKSTWMKVVYTGKGTPPKIFKEQEDLVAYVSDTKGAIGYVDAVTPLKKGVKVITVK